MWYSSPLRCSRERERAREEGSWGGLEEGDQSPPLSYPGLPIGQETFNSCFLSYPLSRRSTFMSIACALAGSFNLLDSLKLKRGGGRKKKRQTQKPATASRRLKQTSVGRESHSARAPYREASPVGISYPSSCSTGGKWFPSMKQAWDKNVFENGQSKQQGTGPVDSAPSFEHLQK